MEECRCCLRALAGAVEGRDVWTGRESGEARLCELLRECAGLQINESEDMPRLVCEVCAELLYKFHAFRHRCQVVDRILWERLHLKERLPDSDEDQPKRRQKKLFKKSKTKRKNCSQILRKWTKKAHLLGTKEYETLSGENVDQLTKSSSCDDSLSKLSSCDNVMHYDEILTNSSPGDDMKEEEGACALGDVDHSSSADDSPSHKINATAYERAASKRPQKKKRRLTTYVCEQCGYAAADLCTLRVHARFHNGERPYHCTHCGKSFAISANLKAHLRTHSGERPYVCEECGRAFAAAASLRGHARVHTGERPYACDTCDRAFALKSNLRQHARVHSGEKPYSCDLCPKLFASSSDVRAHRRTHTGERPHLCPACPKRFALASNLRQHQRTHARPDEQHKCQECGDEFTCRSALATHVRVHNAHARDEAKQHVCATCGKRFARRANLTLHQRRQKACANETADAQLANQATALANVGGTTNRELAPVRPSDQCVVVQSQQIITDNLVASQRAAVTLMQIQRAPGAVRLCSDGQRPTIATVVPLALLPLSVLR